MDSVPPWAMDLFQRLPPSQQMRLQETLMKVVQNPYYLPLATIPVSWGMCYIPHAIAVTTKVLTKGPLGYNNDTPRTENAESYPKIYARCSGAHYNSLEMFPVFAVAVLMARVQKVNPTELLQLCAKYMKLRLIYILLYTMGINKVINAGRTLVWGMLVQTIFEIFGTSL